MDKATLLAVFDLDGTLVDTAPDLTASLNYCLQKQSMPLMTLDEVRPHAGHGSRAMLRAAYARADRELTGEELEKQVTCFLTYYESHIADHSHLFSGAAEALDRLEAAGHVLAICTNKSTYLARLLLESLGHAARFAAICGFDSFAQCKPDPIHLLGTVAMAGCQPPDTVMIGDTQTDVATALAAGIPSVLVDFGYDPNIAARDTATRVISSFDEIDVSLLRELVARNADNRLTGPSPGDYIAARSRVGT